MRRRFRPGWVGIIRSASRAIELVGTVTTTRRAAFARAWRAQPRIVGFRRLVINRQPPAQQKVTASIRNSLATSMSTGPRRNAHHYWRPFRVKIVPCDHRHPLWSRARGRRSAARLRPRTAGKKHSFACVSRLRSSLEDLLLMKWPWVPCRSAPPAPDSHSPQPPVVAVENLDPSRRTASHSLLV